ncbi:hypothetical protein NIES2101_09135 [Calothrix sp. HK-06]|nr:hypothetical protein NIES2101_09135 [Calothrix sp. HK-06]
MLNSFTQKPEPYLFKGEDASDYEVVVGRAGTWCTRHRASGETIQSVQPGFDMLNIVSLGLNILNLGVGIYNATQLRKVKKKLGNIHQEVQSGIEKLENKLERNNEEVQTAFNIIHEQIQASFNSIKSALTVQHRTLELLVSSQNDIAKKMNILREEMRTGFQQVIEEVKDIEALRKREEFETRTFKLLKAYERFTYILPELTEADQLIERAEDLEAWLRTQLNRIEPGKAERLPLFVALAFSVRAKADAFEAKGGDYTSFAVKEITTLINEICHEADAFCKGLSLYALGVEMPEILYQYVLLYRSLRKGLELQKQPETQVLFSENQMIWDDGLEDFRNLFNSNIEHVEVLEGTKKIALETLQDYDWYIRFAGEDRLSFSVHSRPSILLSEILLKIGHPNPQNVKIGKNVINTLMDFALPEKNNYISHLIQSEFALETSPLIFGCGNK